MVELVLGYMRKVRSVKLVAAVSIGLTFTLVGCGSKLIYQNLDWVAMDYVQDYVNLDGEQESILERRLDSIIEWHRLNEIPAYQQHLAMVRDIQPAQVTPKFVDQQRELIQQHTERFITRIAPDVLEIALSLDAEQKQEFLENLADTYEEYDERYLGLTLQETRESYAERIEESIERWVGNINREQKALLKQWVGAMQVSSAEWRIYRSTMHGEVEALLDSQDKPEFFNKQFQRLMFERERYYSRKLDTMIEHNLVVTSDYIAQFAQTMTERQWKHYRSEVDDWSRIAQEVYAND